MPMTLFDLDAAGLDTTLPVPPDFLQFLFDNSRFSYVTLWSARLEEPEGGANIQRWINDGLRVYYSRSLLTQMAPIGDKPTGEGVTEITYGGSTTPPPPVCVTAPLIYGPGEVGQTLVCTMGNWDNVPTDYAYAWSSGGTGETYVVQAGDAGTDVTCTVTASNAGGSTAGPPSNAITIAGAQAAAQAPAPKEEPKREREPEREHHARDHHRSERDRK